MNMAEEEKTAALLDSTILERRKKCRQELELKRKCREEFLRRYRKGLLEESLLTTTLLKAAFKHHFQKFWHLDSVPAIGLSIGGYSRFTGKDVSVRACFLYRGPKLQWEIVEGPLKRRISLNAESICGLELKLNEYGLACLTVEVNGGPSYWLYDPDYKKWSGIANFTDETENLLPHHVVFKPGTVHKIYESFSSFRKEVEVVMEKHLQQGQKQQLRLDEEAKLRKKKEAKYSEE